MHRIILSAVLIITANIVSASPFKVEGETIYFDTINTEGSGSIEYGHQDELLKLLKENDGIKIIVLNSDGGMIEPAMEMASLIIDANLDTHVEFECYSSCVTVFLGGRSRTLALGGKLGFHKTSWAADSIKEYYESEKESSGWKNHSEFASWLYEDAQNDVFIELEYLLERGVEASFAIQTLKANPDGMWYPRRRQLREGRILTE